MCWHSARFSWLRALGVAVVALGLATAATAAVREGDAAADLRRAQIEQWKGRYCTPIGCSGAGESPWSSAAGFGAVVLASGWIARRRPARDD